MARSKAKVKPNQEGNSWDPTDTCDVSVPYLIERAEEEGVFSYDLETTGLSPRKDRIEGVAFYVPNEKNPSQRPVRAWFPFTDGTMEHTVDGEVRALREPVDQRSTMLQLRELWDLKHIIAVRHNGIFDDAFLYLKSGLDEPLIVNNVIADSMLADYIADERLRRYGLKPRVDQVFGHKMTTYSEAFGGQATFGFANKKPLGVYAADDCAWTYRLWKWAINSMRKQDPPRKHKGEWCSPLDDTPGVYSDLEKIYWKIEMKIQRILMEMEITGCFIDWEWLVTVQERINKEQQEILNEFKETVGWVPNLRSPKQVSDFLYNPPEKGGLGLPTKGVDYNEELEQYGTGDKAIKHRKDQFPLVGKLLKYRSLSVIDSSFCKKLISLANDPDNKGRIYARFRQTGTVIGRLSCISGTSKLSIRLRGENFRRSVRISELGRFAGTDVMIITHEGREGRVLNLFNKGPDLMFEVVTDDGNRIRCTRDHRFLTNNGWRDLKDLERGDRLLRAEVCETKAARQATTLGARSTLVHQGLRRGPEAGLQEGQVVRAVGWDQLDLQGSVRMGVPRTVSGEPYQAPGLGGHPSRRADMGSPRSLEGIHTLEGVVQEDLRRQQSDARAGQGSLRRISSGPDQGGQDLQAVLRRPGSEARQAPERIQEERGGVLPQESFGDRGVQGSVGGRDRRSAWGGGIHCPDGHATSRDFSAHSRNDVLDQQAHGYRVQSSCGAMSTSIEAVDRPGQGVCLPGRGVSETDVSSECGQAERIVHAGSDRARGDREVPSNLFCQSSGDETLTSFDGGWNPASASVLFLQELASGLRLARKETTGRGRWRVSPEVREDQGQGSSEGEEGEGTWLPSGEVHYEADRQGPPYGDQENRVRTWARVTSITPVSVEDVWDITVEGDHSYLAQGFVNHNSADPVNLMNQPRDKDLIRKAFCAHLENDYDEERSQLCLIDADYCLVAGTPIVTVNGVMPIEEVAATETPVLSSADGRSLEIRPVVAGGKVGIAPCVELVLEDGSSVICTEDHKWMTYGGRLVETKYLNPGDRLAHVRETQLGRYKMWAVRGVAAFQHIVLAEHFHGERPEGHDADHINGDTFDNRGANLRWLPSRENRGQGAQRWWDAATLSQRRRKKQQLVEGQRKNRRSYKADGNPNHGNLKGAVTNCASCGSAFYQPPSADGKFCSRACYHKSRENGCDLTCARCGVVYYRSDGKKTRFCSRECFTSGKPGTKACLTCNQDFLPTKSAARFCGRSCANRGRAKSDNHRIVSITPVGSREVWQITVEGTHTYVLENGLVSGQSQMELRMAAHLANELNMIEVFLNTGHCRNKDGAACDRYLNWSCNECGHTWQPEGWLPDTDSNPALCPGCGLSNIEHQKRCRHVDLHQRTAEDVQVKRNPLAKNCVTADAMLLTEHGLLEMGEVVTEPDRFKKRIGIMSDDGQIRYTDSTWSPGVRSVVDVNLEYGIKLTATPDHEFFVMRGGKVERVMAADLRPDDPCLIMTGRDVHGKDVALPSIDVVGGNALKDIDLPTEMTPEVARFFGYFVSEGRMVTDESRGYYQMPFGFGDCSVEMVEDFIGCWRLVVNDRTITEHHPLDKEATHYTVASKKLNLWMAHLGFKSCSGEKDIPRCVRSAPWSLKREFFRALFEGDGTVKAVGKARNSFAIVYTSKSEKLIRQIHAEMMNIDILGFIHSEMRPTLKGEQPYWCWTVRRQRDIERFAERVGFVSTEKSDKLLEAMAPQSADYANRFLDGVEVLLESIYDKTKRKRKDKLREVIRRKKSPVRFGDTRLELLEDVLPDEIKAYRDAGIWTAKVRSVTDAGEAPVFDVYEPERTAMICNSVAVLDSNFGLLYRMGAPKFCIYAGLFDEDGNPQIGYGQRLIELWHQAYPGIASWHERTINQLVKDNYIAYNIARRRRRLDTDWQKNDYVAGTKAIQFRVSGCVTPSTPVLTEQGYVSIEDLATDRLPIFDGEKFTSDYDVIDSGVKDVFKVTLSSGRTITCSADHRFATMDGLRMVWTKTSELDSGDMLATHDVLAAGGDDDHGASVDDAYLVGALIGDGYYGSSQGFTLAASARDPGWPESLEESVLRSQGETARKKLRWGLRNTNRGGKVRDLVCNSSRARSNLMILGLDCVSKQAKRIPKWAYTASPELRGAVLAGLIDTDGSVLSYKQKTYTSLTINYSSRVRELVEGAWKLASSLGIDCAIRELDVARTGKKRGMTKQYRLDVSYRGFQAFNRWVPLRHPRKAATLAGALQLIATRAPRRELPRSFVSAVAELASRAPALASRQGSSTAFDDRRMRRRIQTYIGHARTGNAGENMIEAVLDYIDEPGPKEVLGYGWDKVVSVEHVGSSPTYDIEIHGDNHAYIAAGFFTHNSCQDLIKLAMIKLYDARNDKVANSRPAESKLWAKFRFMIQVHDELIFQGPRAMKEELCGLVKTSMESVATGMRVPFTADARAGRTWDELH